MDDTLLVISPETNRRTIVQTVTVLVNSWRYVVAVPLAIGASSFALSFLLPKSYTSQVCFMPPSQNSPTSALLSAVGSSLGGLGGAISGSLTGLKSPTDQWIAILNSRTIADRQIKKHNLLQIYDVALMKDARDVLDSRTNAWSDKSGLIWVDVEDRDPQRAADIANDYVSILRDVVQNQLSEDALRKRKFYEKETVKARTLLAEAQKQLEASGISETALKINPDVALARLTALKGEAAAMQIQLSALSQTQTSINPEYQRLASSLSALNSQIRKIETHAATNDGTDSRYVDAYRNFKYLEVLFEVMSRQYEMAKAEEIGLTTTIQLVDAAVPSEKQSKPRRVIIAGLSMLVTSLLAIIIVLLKDSFSKADSRTKEELRILRSALSAAKRKV